MGKTLARESGSQHINLWEIDIRPAGRGADVTITLNGQRACNVRGAICTAGGKRLINTLSQTVPLPTDRTLNLGRLWAHWTGSGATGGNTLSSPCTGTKCFRVIWSKPTDSNGRTRIADGPSASRVVTDNMHGAVEWREHARNDRDLDARRPWFARCLFARM